MKNKLFLFCSFITVHFYNTNNANNFTCYSETKTNIPLSDHSQTNLLIQKYSTSKELYEQGTFATAITSFRLLENENDILEEVEAVEERITIQSQVRSLRLYKKSTPPNDTLKERFINLLERTQ